MLSLPYVEWIPNWLCVKHSKWPTYSLDKTEEEQKPKVSFTRIFSPKKYQILNSDFTLLHKFLRKSLESEPNKIKPGTEYTVMRKWLFQRLEWWPQRIFNGLLHWKCHEEIFMSFPNLTWHFIGLQYRNMLSSSTYTST